SASADLSVSLSAPSTVLAGNQLTYTLTVSNNGPSNAHGVTLTDTLPSGITSLTGGNTITETLDILAAGGSATFTFVGLVPANTAAGVSLVNTASVSAATSDANTSNNSATSTTTVNASADLAVSITGPSSAIAGDPDPII